MDIPVAALLAIGSAGLLVGALAALIIGWFWVEARGDWQAIALWGYWFGTPALSGIPIAATGANRRSTRLDWALLAVWVAASLLALLVPLLS
jgi:hypothetical protein